MTRKNKYSDINEASRKIIEKVKAQELIPDETIKKSWINIENELKKRARFSKIKVLFLAIAASIIVVFISKIFYDNMFFYNDNKEITSISNICFYDTIPQDFEDVALRTETETAIIKDKSQLQYNSGDTYKEKNEEELNHLIVPYGKRIQVILSDGTQMYVNSGTQLIYPSRFIGATRNIFIKGEAFLQVAKDNEHPFIITSESNIKTVVLGTSFNISTQKDSVFSVVLVEGSVKVETSESDIIILKPNEKYLNDGVSQSVNSVNTSEYIAWINYIMYLSGKNLGYVLNDLSIHFGVDIICDPNLRSMPTGGKLDLKKGVDYALSVLSESLDLTYNKNEKGVWIVKKE